MDYALSFLEGVKTFISPCLLPMLPIYVSYFAGGGQEGGTARTAKNALGFILGFTLVFLSLGVFAGAIGRVLIRYQTVINLVTGAIVILFGLNYLGVLRLNLGLRARETTVDVKNLGFFSSLLFGLTFSISWTPCVSAFLSAALSLAAQKGSAFQGMLMLLAYSLGLGIPFFASALLIKELKSAFDFIKRHYNTINKVSGLLLVVIGLLMMTGTMGRFLALMNF